LIEIEEVHAALEEIADPVANLEGDTWRDISDPDNKILQLTLNLLIFGSVTSPA
jgi:hypothetical protein